MQQTPTKPDHLRTLAELSMQKAMQLACEMQPIEDAYFVALLQKQAAAHRALDAVINASTRAERAKRLAEAYVAIADILRAVQ